MKKYKKRDKTIFIISILVIALLFSFSGILVNLKAHTYTTVIDKEYSYDVDTSSVILFSSLKKNESFIEGYGPRTVALNYGQNALPIQIRQNNGTTNEYFININRKDTRQTESRLSSLEVSNNKLDFDKDKYTYAINVGKDVDYVNVNATLLSPSSHFIEGYGPRRFELQDGLNVAQIKVKSEAGTEKYYKINIFKNDSKLSKYKYIDDLESLTIDCGDIKFNPEKKEYKITTSKERANIYAFTSSADTKVEIQGDNNLIVGDNIFNVKVVKDDSVLKEYKIIVSKKDPEVTGVEKVQLKDLKVSGFNIDFKPDEYTYDLSLKSDTNLIVSAFPKDSNATVNIIETNQKDKQQIQIVVSNNENKKVYTVNIREVWFTKSKEVALQFIIFVIAFCLIINVKFMEYNHKKRRKNTKKGSK